MFHRPVAVRTFADARASNDAIRDRLAETLDRIDEVEPHIYALVPERGRRQRVTAELETLIARYPAHAPRPALFGVPVGVKDIFCVDGLPTRVGSKLPARLFAGPEAISVSRLRAAGAVIVGKTITTEFAYFAPGPTRNPWNPAHTPGGSSSGSAAAVSAGYCPFALGTQTIGSVNRPAAFCGIVGLKPSYGRVATDGVLPFSVSADHVGVLAADVASVRAGAEVVWDDWRDGAACGGRHDSAAGRGVVLVLDDAYAAQADDEARGAVAGAATALERDGWTVRRVGLFDAVEPINEAHNRMVAREFADVHERWAAEWGHLYAPQSLKLLERGRGVTDAELDEARAGRAGLRARAERLLESERAVCIVSPGSMTAAPAGIDATGSPIMNLPWTHAGLPTITLPVCRNRAGLPLGVQITSSYGSDEQLVELASQFEPVLRSVASASQ
jgi:Asp-tRNA(Asn)/Glu-tRNA(Gln) amidotransferase A subunit family amidase